MSRTREELVLYLLGLADESDLDGYDCIPMNGEKLREAAARLRESEGERIEGWATVHELEDFRAGTNDLVMVGSSEPENNHLFHTDIPVVILHAQQEPKNDE